MDQKKTGYFLKELRKEKALTQEQVSEQFGVTQRTILRWETGSNMPDLSMLVGLAEFYDVDVREIIDGERKCENMDKEAKETLIKVADYAESLNAKSMYKGVTTMAIVYIILVFISYAKEISPAPLGSMMCAYNSATFLSNTKYGKDKTDFTTGILFLVGAIINTGTFIIK